MDNLRGKRRLRLLTVPRHVIQNPPQIFSDVDNVYQPPNDIRAHLSDSLIFNVLKEIIRKNGFPSSALVRRKSAFNANIILHHSVRMPKNVSYLQVLREKIKTGQYHPFWYAFAADQYHFFYKKERPVYYIGLSVNNFKLTAEELKTVDEARRSIGLYTIAQEEKRKSKSK